MSLSTSKNENLASQSQSYTARKFAIAKYLTKMNERDKAENNKIIKSMQKKTNFLKNPRFKINRPPITFSQAALSESNINEKSNPLRITPEIITFSEYKPDCVYEIPLVITNAGNISHRFKYLPPGSQEFSVSSVSYPLNSDLIAPGMSATLHVLFQANSMSDYDDELVIISDESSFKIKLQARKEHPILNLPEIWDCQSCWLGDRLDMVFPFTNKGGEGSFKFFCESEEDDAKQSGEILKIKNFTIFPSEFYIGKGQNMELFVSFIPQKDGIITEKVILACDNNTSKIYTLTARSNMAELQIIALNGHPLKTDAVMLKHIHFEDIDPCITKTNIITVKNEASVNVNYKWMIKTDEDNSINKHAKLKIEPEKGIFQGSSSIDFKLTFNAKLSLPFFNEIAFTIDDIPFEGIRNPPDIIKNQYLEYKSSQKALRPSITYFEFEVCALLNLNRVQIEPTVYVYPGSLLMNHIYSKKFTITNYSEGCVTYEIILHEKTQYIQYILDHTQGVLKPKSHNLIEIKLWGEKPSLLQKCVFIIKAENCEPLSFQICGNFSGPTIKIYQPEIDFGLVKTNSSKQFILDIENLSDIQAPILLRKFNDKVDFNDYMNKDEPYYQWWNEKIYFIPQYYILQPYEKAKLTIQINSESAETFHDIIEILVANNDSHMLKLHAEIQDMHVILNSYLMNFPILYAENNYSITSKHEKALVMTNLGNIPAQFEWENVNKEEIVASFIPQKGIIQPKSSINIDFQFTPKIGQKLKRLFFCNVEGLEYPIGFELQAQVDGLSVSYECIDEVLIGTGNMLGTHGNNNNSGSFMSHQKNNKSEKSVLSFTNGGLKSLQQINLLEEKSPPVIPFEKIELLNLKINEPHQIKVLLKNTSGIPTTFHFYMEKYEPYHHHNTQNKLNLSDYTDSMMQSNQELSNQLSQKTSKHVKFGNDVIKYTQDRKRPYSHNPLLTDQIEKTHNFSSINGQEMNKKKKLDKDQKFYLMNNKGVAIACEPNKGNLLAHEEITIVITIYNDSCGRIEDYLCSEIKGLPKVRFPVLLNITGSPLNVTPNQVGVNYSTEYPTIAIANIMRNSTSASKEIRLSNTGPYDIEFEWKVFNLEDNQLINADIFNIKITEPDLGKNDIVKVLFDPIEPNESLNGPFYINPKIARIKGRETSIFNITFAGQILGEYKGVIVAKPKLSSNENMSRHEADLGILPVYIYGTIVQPILKLDKRALASGSHLVKFEKWALCPNKKEERHLILKNKTLANLIFNVQLEGPFKLVSTRTNSANKYEANNKINQKQYIETNFNMTPQSLLELNIKFSGLQEKDTENWPLVPTITYTGKIIISYTNNDKQIIELEGELLRPILGLNSAGFEGKPFDDVIDFGVVHFKNNKQKSIFLINRSKVPGNWKINYIKYPTRKLSGKATITKLEIEDSQKTDDPSVFNFSISQGTLLGPTKPVNMVPKGAAFTNPDSNDDKLIAPIEIILLFQPKKNILYKSKYRITVDEGPNIDFILKGQGTYEENLRK